MKTSQCLPQASDSCQACGSTKQIARWWRPPRSVGNRSWTKWTCSLVSQRTVCILIIRVRIFWTKPLHKVLFHLLMARATKKGRKHRGWVKACTAVSKPFFFSSIENHQLEWPPFISQSNSSHVYCTLFIPINGIGPLQYQLRQATGNAMPQNIWEQNHSGVPDDPWEILEVPCGNWQLCLRHLAASILVVNWDAVQLSNRETS